MKAPAIAIQPPPYDERVIYAIRAWAEGKANSDQQKIAFQWVVREASRHFDQSMHLGGEDGRRCTDFMEGRRFVGIQILKMLQPEVTPRPSPEPKDKS